MSDTNSETAIISASDTAEVPNSSDDIGKVIDDISSMLDPKQIGTGTLAELRRMGWEEFPPGFWRFYFAFVPEEKRVAGGRPSKKIDQAIDQAWASILCAMAMAAPRPHVFDPNKTFGAVLAETGYSELRFVRFLRAEGEDLAREIRTAATWLARTGQKANWQGPAELILGRIGQISQAPSDDIIHQLARDYFRTQAAKP